MKAGRSKQELAQSRMKEMHLRPWEEIVGTLKKIEDNGRITAVISCTQDFGISYPKGTQEATAIEKLKPYIGRKVAILCTDNPQECLLVKIPNETIYHNQVNIHTLSRLSDEQKSRILTKTIQTEEVPKNERKSHAPTIRTHPAWWG